MTSIMFGQMQTELGVPAEEAVVRNTATPVEVDAPPAMQDDMPEQQELETDPNPNLGMNPRQLASHWHEGQTVTPQFDTATLQGEVNQNVNRRIAGAGTAASREQSGEVHKTLSYAVGIEPVSDLADDNHKFGNTYFVREDRDVQAGSGDYMTVPPGMGNPGTQENVMAAGKVASREAAQSSIYNAFWNGGAQV